MGTPSSFVSHASMSSGCTHISLPAVVREGAASMLHAMDACCCSGSVVTRGARAVCSVPRETFQAEVVGHGVKGNLMIGSIRHYRRPGQTWEAGHEPASSRLGITVSGHSSVVSSLA